MSLCLTAASIALAAVFANGDSCTSPTTFITSKPNARILVSVNDKPAGHLHLRFSVEAPIGGTSQLEISTDARGFFELKNLPAGRNCFDGFAYDGQTRLEGSLCLDVSAGLDASASEIRLMMAPFPPPPPPTTDELAKRNEKSSIELITSVLEGTVADFTGAVIPRAEIFVYRRDSESVSKPEKTKTDDEGNFAVPVGPGKYTVAAVLQGFKTRFIGLEIKKDAQKQKLAIKLDVEPVCMAN